MENIAVQNLRIFSSFLYSSNKASIEGYKKGSCFHASLGRIVRKFFL